MSARILLASFLLLAVVTQARATEAVVPIQAKPSQAEFVVAAKRALFARNYEIWSVDPDVVIGRYRGKVEMAFILTDNAVFIRNIEPGGMNQETISKYLRSLKRDFTYEIVQYALPPVGKSDPSKIAGLLSSTRAAVSSAPETTSNALISGQYQSQIEVTSNHSWIFRKRREREIMITFKQDGNDVIGTNLENGLKIVGKLEGNQIRFYTLPSKISTGEIKGVWTVSEDGRRLEGTWSASNSAGDWNLTRAF
jgi:hypothetical protein